MKTHIKKNKPASISSNAVWNLSVLYKNAHDPQIEKDIALFEQKVVAFEKHKKNISKLGSPEYLKRALDELERLDAMPETARAGYYFGLRRELNAQDDEAEKKLNLLSDRLTKLGNRVIFFDLALGRLTSDVQRKLLLDKRLVKYHYHLKNLFDTAKHHLSEPEEKLMSLKSNTSHGLWVAGTDKILNRRNVMWKGKKLPLPEAIEITPKLAKGDRRKLWSLIVAACKDLGEIAENELTAIVLDKKVNDELRGFKNPYSATVLGYENSEASVEALVASVKAHYGIAHRFYKLKAKMLKEKKLQYVDRNVSVGKESEISFNDSTATLREVFYTVDPKYADVLDMMLDKKQIDAYPKKGKTSGAFCASETNVPTYVLLNFIPGSRSLMTYAHEMGHAVHAERSKTQSPLYQGHSTAVAETASTLFENLVFDANIRTLGKKERIIALHDKIQDDIASIMRQVAFFEYEREMHEIIRKNGAMNHDELATLMQKHLKSYLGPAVEVTKEDGYMFVYVSHFRRFFYVYTYAYGNLISNAIAARLREDATFTKQIDAFLTAGCSKSPDDIFKAMGIDVTKPEFFTAGLARLNDRITEHEGLVFEK